MKLKYRRDQSSNKSSFEDDVNGNEDWREVGFDYFVKVFQVLKNMKSS